MQPKIQMLKRAHDIALMMHGRNGFRKAHRMAVENAAYYREDDPQPNEAAHWDAVANALCAIYEREVDRIIDNVRIRDRNERKFMLGC